MRHTDDHLTRIWGTDVADYVFTSPTGPIRRSELFGTHEDLMVSHRGTTLAADMGYVTESGRWRPGISVFRRHGATIQRVSDAVWSPGDDFCTLWHFFDLLPEGAAGWSPKFSYP